jgi:glycosyltransferase involved in cell wall biosynthesis
MGPAISVCIPAYNAARTLEATLASVLEQDADFAVTVLDNASDDGTGDIARSFGDERVHLFRNETLLPLGDNWNRVVALSTAPLVKLVCADDLIAPGSLAREREVLDDPTIAIVSGLFSVIDEKGAVKESGLGLPGLDGRRDARTTMATIVRRGPADFGPTAGAMFRREHFDRVGGFRPALLFPMDVDLFARLTAHGDFFGLSEEVASWRDSTFNICATSSSWSKLSEMLRMHHLLAREFPRYLAPADVVAGDLRLLRAGLERVQVRSRALVGRWAS